VEIQEEGSSGMRTEEDQVVMNTAFQGEVVGWFLQQSQGVGAGVGEVHQDIQTIAKVSERWKCQIRAYYKRGGCNLGRRAGRERRRGRRCFCRTGRGW
jgi:hypothetical protein